MTTTKQQSLVEELVGALELARRYVEFVTCDRASNGDEAGENRSAKHLQTIDAALTRAREETGGAPPAPESKGLYDALHRLHAWGRPFIETTPISAETLWREFPAAMENASSVIDEYKAARAREEGNQS